MVKINKRYMIQNDCYKDGRKIIPKGVFWHSTAAHEGEQVPSDYYFDRWNKPGITKCVHAFIDETDVTEMLPTEKGNCWRGWHAGQGSKGSFNDTHIGFEMIEPKDYKDKAYFEKVYENAILYTVMLFERYGWTKVTEENLLCHCEGYIKFQKASNHGDVMHWFKLQGKTMDDVRKEVQRRLDNNKKLLEKKPKTPVVKPTTPTPTKPVEKVVKPTPTKVTKTMTAYTTDNLNCRVSGSATAKLVGTFKKGTTVTATYSVGDTWYQATGTDKNGKKIIGYVNSKYLSLTKPLIKKTMTTTSSLNCRNKGTVSGKVVGVFKKGTKITVTYTQGDVWYKASGKSNSGKTISGYVHSDYLK